MATAAAPAATGQPGEDVELHVPVGTEVRDDAGELVADLVRPGARVVVARGGAAGRGNKQFATPTRQTPRFAEVGMPGDEADVELHLKLLADAALVGQPNAGKSSLLRRISNAKPKVADYPFTTLAPMLGTVDAPTAGSSSSPTCPGLIEGAAEGIGLGHEFLAHLERARVLVHVIDAAAGDPAEQFRAVDGELAAYGGGARRAAADRRAEQDRHRTRPGARASTTSASSASSRCRVRRARGSSSSGARCSP